jgi:hypothetical protein
LTGETEDTRGKKKHAGDTQHGVDLGECASRQSQKPTQQTLTSLLLLSSLLSLLSAAGAAALPFAAWS